VTSTEEAKRLAGKEDAEAKVAVAVEVAACLPFLPRRFSTIGAAAVASVGISKTARHTGHLKGALPIVNSNDCNQ